MGLSGKTAEFPGDLFEPARNRFGWQDMVHDSSMDGRRRHPRTFRAIGLLSDDDATMLPKGSERSGSIGVYPGENDRNALVTAFSHGFKQHRENIRESPGFRSRPHGKKRVRKGNFLS